MKKEDYIAPEAVLARIYGKNAVHLGMSERRRDEVLAAAIFTAFRNQEYGTKLKLPRDFKSQDYVEDAQGIDVIALDENGRKKELQIKGVYIERSIQRRKNHRTGGEPRLRGRRTWQQVVHDSEELTKILRKELEKIVQDYSGIYLIIHVIADLATQTSLEIAMRNSRDVVTHLKAKEVWFLRHIPVRDLRGKKMTLNTHTFQLIKLSPDRHVYTLSFAL